jgi:hypothetical protein
MGSVAAGYPEGTLKAIAQSGLNGSQYVTNPANLANRPFSGVTYVELAPATAWLAANISGSGIIVVHNSTYDASMGNVHGTFNGVIIADDIAHINSGTTIYGAVVGLSTLPSMMNDLGNGNSDIDYSSTAIQNATGSVNPLVVKTYSDKIIAWWE